MSLLSKINSRLLHWRNRIQRSHVHFRPGKHVVATASLVATEPGIVFHALGLQSTHLPVRPDLFAQISPYFTYDAVDKLEAEPAFIAQHARGVAEVPNGRLYTDNQGTIAIITEAGTLLGDISYQYNVDRALGPEANEALQMRRWKEPRKLNGTVLSLLAGGGSTHNYGHFLIDGLSRLGLAEWAGIRQEEIDWYLVPATRISFQRELLDLLGIPMEKVVVGQKGMHIQADRLVATTHPRGNRSYLVPDWMMDWARRRMLAPSLSRTQGKTYSPYIYITRRDSSIRNVENEAEVIAYLEKRGYEAYTLAELPVVEKVALFAQAKVIISVSGAGLNNLIFSQPGAGLVEIFPPSLIHTQYYQMARHVGLRYAYFLTDDLPHPARNMAKAIQENVIINVDKLGKALAELEALAPARA